MNRELSNFRSSIVSKYDLLKKNLDNLKKGNNYNTTNIILIFCFFICLGIFTLSFITKINQLFDQKIYDEDGLNSIKDLEENNKILSSNYSQKTKNKLIDAFIGIFFIASFTLLCIIVLQQHYFQPHETLDYVNKNINVMFQDLYDSQNVLIKIKENFNQTQGIDSDKITLNYHNIYRIQEKIKKIIDNYKSIAKYKHIQPTFKSIF